MSSPALSSSGGDSCNPPFLALQHPHAEAGDAAAGTLTHTEHDETSSSHVPAKPHLHSPSVPAPDESSRRDDGIKSLKDLCDTMTKVAKRGKLDDLSEISALITSVLDAVAVFTAKGAVPFIVGKTASSRLNITVEVLFKRIVRPGKPDGVTYNVSCVASSTTPFPAWLTDAGFVVLTRCHF